MVTLEEAKAWLRVDGDTEDALLLSFIQAAEDIVNGILRRPVSGDAPETVKQAVIYAVSRFYEERESLDILGLMAGLRGMLFAYREAAW